MKTHLLIVILFLVSRFVGASQFEFEGQFLYSPVESDAVAQGGSYSTMLTRYLYTKLGARIASSAWQLDRVEYAGTLSYFPVTWFSVSTRITQRSLLSTGSGASDLLTTGRLDKDFFSFLGAFVEFGWYERWIHLRTKPILPALSSVSARDRDLAARFGLRIIPIQPLAVTISAGTIEDILVFNLNNPFMELRTTFHARDWEIFAFSRYKLLLGFGRLDELCLGLGVTVL